MGQKKQGIGSSLANHFFQGLREGALILFGTLAVYLFLALYSYHPSDPVWSHKAIHEVANFGGLAGAWLSELFLRVFGLFSYLIPLAVAYGAWFIFKGWKKLPLNHGLGYFLAVKFLGFLMTMGAGTGLAQMHFSTLSQAITLNSNGGGLLGQFVATQLVVIFNGTGSTLFLIALFLTGITLTTGVSLFRMVDLTGKASILLWGYLRNQLARYAEHRAQRKIAVEEERARKRAQKKLQAKLREKEKEKKKKVSVAPRVEPVIRQQHKADKKKIKKLRKSQGDLPPIDLLDEPVHTESGMTAEEIETMSRMVEEKLKDFGIQVEVVHVQPGPVITRFEIMPAPGVKVSQISNLSKDLARSLSVLSVRVVEIIAGKSVIGLEIPNDERETVYLSETFLSKEYQNAKSPLTLALGKDISGKPSVVDLAKMPHLLVAGTTGSGKSVALNVMILSMLYKAPAEEVRLIMVDPKMLELSIYEGIPHLLAPVVTDMKEAANALRWCVGEMEKRYRLMAHMGVRNITNYNKKIKEAIANGKPIDDPLYKPVDPTEPGRTLEPLPFIVVVIDELADMMMMVGKKVEELIARLAQKARASGIHLILATQRPSVDVLTGLIKANIPTRIAFQVSSKTDSRTIIDKMGAEQLLGHGDMLYLPPGTGMAERVHGAFVGDNEVHDVVDYLKEVGSPEYDDNILQGDTDGLALPGIPGMDSNSETDELYDQAVRIVTETRRASVSSIQRRLKIGYNRAARMVEAMEESGIVGPLQSNGTREVIAPPPPEI